MDNLVGKTNTRLTGNREVVGRTNTRLTGNREVEHAGPQIYCFFHFLIQR